MGCLYCGKEIGPIRLIRDDEFCSSVHRKRYKERLGKALIQLDGPEAAPAPPADFVCPFPFKIGNIRYVLDLSGLRHHFDIPQYRRAMPLSVSSILGGSPLALPGIRAANPVLPSSLAPPESGGCRLRLPSQALQIALDTVDDNPFAVPSGPAKTVALPLAAVDGAALLPAHAEHVARSISEIPPGFSLPAAAPFLSRAEQTRPLQVHTAPVPAQFVTPAATVADMASDSVQLPRFEIAAADAATEPLPVPAACPTFIAGPPAEAVAVHILVIAAPEPCSAPLAARLPHFEIAATEPLLVPAARPTFITGPAAEAVAVHVLVISAPEPCSAPLAACLPEFEIAAADACMEPVPVPAVCQAFISAPAAEAVAVHVLPISTPESCSAPLAARLPEFGIAAAQARREPLPVPAVSEGWIPGAAAEAIDMEGHAQADPATCTGPVAPRLPNLQVAADARNTAPAFCQRWMAGPAAEPVEVELVAGFHSESCGVPDFMLPSLGRFAIADPWMPMSLRLRPSLTAEPVAMNVAPQAAMAEQQIYQQVTGPLVPGVPYLPGAGTGSQSTPLQPPVAGLKPELVERIVVPASKPVQADLEGARILRMPATPNPDLRPAARLASRAMSLEAEPVETMPSFQARQAWPLTVALELQLPALPQPAAENFRIAAQSPVMPSILHVAAPAASQYPVAVKPMPTLFVRPPQTPQPEQQMAAIATRGFVPLEFFSQRAAGTPSRKMVWCIPAIRPVLPNFAVHPILERLEKEPQQKKAKKPAFAEIFELPEAARKRAGNAVLRHAIKAIAACFLLGAVLWFGLGAMRIGNQTPAVNRDVSIGDLASGTPSGSAAPLAISPRTGSASIAPKPTGAVGRLRAAISDRAAATVTDSFKNGMEAWGTASKQWAPGWSRHPDGFVRTGQLALFHPTLNYKDYHLEFFGQIESRSMGWAVRAHDTQNYYAMKFTVIEPGLRPMIAMIHYPVVGGKRGKPVQIPLNVMVHNNEPLQVSVDVKGNKLLTSVDGQLVDTWIDDTLVAGGVGFFSDAGERARLYWMKISKNEDFLGRICAYVSSTLGDGSRASAELWPPDLPGVPQHQPPVYEHTQEAALAETAAGLQNRLNKDRRTDTWNS